MRITYNIIGVFVATALLVSCQRKNDIIEPAPLPPGGKGGLIKLQVTPQHHKKDINSGMVYIKYAATKMPESMIFDDSAEVKVEQGRPIAPFEELTEGDYYLYAKGTDYSLEPGKDAVMGGAHFRVIDTLQKTYDLYLQMDNPIHHK